MTDSKAVATTKASQPEKTPPPVDELEQQLLAVAKTPQERLHAFQLASGARQADMVRRVASAMAEVGWGKEISPSARAATIRYCFEIGADPTRHVFVLGGNIFINGTFYREAIAEEPDFLRADDPVWIHDDKRLNDEQREQRRQLRIDNNIPDECPACCIVVGYFEKRGPFKGVGRVRAGNTSSGKPKDPVGVEFPRETAETRAWRELGEKVVGPWLKSHPRLQAAEEVIAQGRLVDVAEISDLPRNPSEERQRLMASAARQEVADSDPQVEGAGQPAAARPKTVKHQPNAICSEDDYHPASECKLEAQ